MSFALRMCATGQSQLAVENKFKDMICVPRDRSQRFQRPLETTYAFLYGLHFCNLLISNSDAQGNFIALNAS